MKASSGRDQQSERYSYGVKARPSQVKVELKVMLPGYYEIVKTSFFPSGLFLESDNATCPPSSTRARVIYWPSKSNKQGPNVIMLKMLMLKMLHP